MTVKGYISKIIYRNEDNAYTVMTVETENDEVCCVGVMAVFDEGEYVEVEGESVFHPQYGDQINVTRITAIEPTGAEDMERYLASGAISGIGAALAKRIVSRFGDDTFRIMEEEPERLSEVKGISEAGAMRIAEQFVKKHELRNAMVFLQKFGISNSLAVKIYEFYGDRMYSVIRDNPYRLAEDIQGVGFKSADEIAMRAGISPNDDFRVRAALLYTLTLATGSGHVYLPEEELMQRTAEMIPGDEEQMRYQLTKLFTENKIVIKDEETRNVYISSFYYMELNVARMLNDLNCKFNISEDKINERIQGVTKDLDLELDDLQKQAVSEAARNGIFVLTGGPGTGKTTTINAIIRFFEREGMDVLLAAPTGRAAKRMSETTGKEAKTIHRLLELTKKPDEGLNTSAGMEFARNENNPLETDVMIVDEVSMVDIALMYALLRAIGVGTRVILVGDVNQLPSVGPGNVLKDIIAAERFNVVRLEKIFRQAAESSIIVNAHKINRGEEISLDNRVNNDFFFLERRDVSAIVEGIIYLVQTKISGFAGVSPFEVQVLTPMKAGELGCERLNLTLQNTLNPGSRGKAEKVFDNGKVFREGDKVMQIKNDYQLEWTVKSKRGIVIDSGTGVFNGDCGIIREIDLLAEHITVEFEEGRTVDYSFSQHDELVLAYAITIHKSQGSEYPAVVMPLLNGPSMLFNRNVLYTAVTRAKKCVTIIGSSDTVRTMIRNTMEQKRYSGLERAIRDVRTE
ncbi:MAG: ATP-dependent RecD-like DNA helicase [Lachnospiraceae bacterium]|nr:ATP-dependent RecD-like DNA helicase [Lachnospiraceae bacterium]